MISAENAIENASRRLEQAEMELTNLPLMERLENLATSWLAVAHLVMERERA
ncbi:hypothetical protein ACFYW6_07050 [Streptomyces sp. NPDC002659]|uniref:hypothetical protein n=1 Tax=Streptomyces sp. NPDC002659 TaxID=3364656 RepID=UPI003676D0B3